MGAVASRMPTLQQRFMPRWTQVSTSSTLPNHRSEKLLGQFMQGSTQNVVVATKFFPLPWRFSRWQLVSALRGSVKRLRLARVNLYQIHWPSPLMPVERAAAALADAVEAGLT